MFVELFSQNLHAFSAFHGWIFQLESWFSFFTKLLECSPKSLLRMFLIFQIQQVQSLVYVFCDIKLMSDPIRVLLIFRVRAWRTFLFLFKSFLLIQKNFSLGKFFGFKEIFFLAYKIIKKLLIFSIYCYYFATSYFSSCFFCCYLILFYSYFLYRKL